MIMRDDGMCEAATPCSRRKFRAAIVKMVDRVLSFPLVGNMQLLHVVLICTGGAFAETIRQTVHLSQKRASELIETPNVVTGLLARKWRAERNFWLSFFCFTLWCLLAAFYRLQVQMLALEDRLAANGDDFGSVPPRKPVQPSAPPLSSQDSKPSKKDA